MTSDTTTPSAKPAKPTFEEILNALMRRKTLAMFILGFAAGLPYILITGTLNAWFTNENIDIKTIGVFSWIIIIYGFKFLWSPAIDRFPSPPLFSMGQRRAGILLLQIVIIICLAVISMGSPQEQISLIAMAAVLCTFASASQDILIDAWRIEVADEETTVDLLSSVYQVGYRLAAILGGAGALIIAARIGWNNTFVALAALMGVAVSGVFVAMDAPRLSKAAAAVKDSLPTQWRNWGLSPVILGWVWSFFALFGFMAFALNNPDAADARVFTREKGPIIVFVSIVIPFIVAAIMLRLDEKPKEKIADKPWPAQTIIDNLYGAILTPMIDVIRRLRWGAIIVLVLILSYRFVDLVWGAFAYPFYLGENFGALGHTLDEVAIASKVFGSIMTFMGITVGATAILKFGRMPCLFVGAILAAATNLLFADLAQDGAVTHSVLSTLHLYGVFGFLQPLADLLSLDVTMNEALTRLMIVIAAENLAVGFASAAIVVYLSSIVNPRFAAVQYALFASLTMLIGSLGRGALGVMIEERGFAYVFYLTAVLGLVAVIASGAEWIRQSRQSGTAEPSS